MKTTRGSSRGGHNPPAGPSTRGGSRGSLGASSRPSLRLSSRLERTQGGLYLPPVPELLSGPEITPQKTTANVTWELDPSGTAGFHRVRTKEGAGGDWVEHAWSDAAGYSADVDISGLTADNTLYYLDLQSAGDLDDETTWMSWTPGDNTESFRTLCSSAVLTVSNMNALKVSEMGFDYLRLSWDTDYKTSDKELRIKEGYAGAWVYFGPTADSGTSHLVEHTTFKFTQGAYYWNVRNKNACGVQTEWQPADKGFYCDAGGAIAVQW